MGLPGGCLPKRRSPDSVPLVVGDRVTETARRLLVEHRAGYYDLRGHVALRSPSVVIDADVEPVTGRVESVHALSGTAGLEVATALLMEPAAGVAVRDLYRLAMWLDVALPAALIAVHRPA